MVTGMFLHLKPEDIPAKLEIYNTLVKNNTPKMELSGIISETNQKNLGYVNELLSRNVPVEKMYSFIYKVNNTASKHHCSQEFMLENLEYLKTIDWQIIDVIDANNIDILKAIQADIYFPKAQITKVLNSVTKENKAEMLENITKGNFLKSEHEKFLEKAASIQELIFANCNKEKYDRIKEYENDYEPYELLDKIWLNKDITLTDAQRKEVQNFVNEYQYKSTNFIPDSNCSADCNLLDHAKEIITYIQKGRESVMRDLSWTIHCIINNNNLDETIYNQKEILANFKKNIAPKLSLEELNLVKEIMGGGNNNSLVKFDDAGKRLTFDYSLIFKRNLLETVGHNLDKRMDILSDLLYCSDEEFAKKAAALNSRRVLKNPTARDMDFKTWKRLLEMPQDEYERFTTAAEKRTPETVDINEYRAQMEERIRQPLNYSPEAVSNALNTASLKESLRTFNAGSSYRPQIVNPFEKLPAKERITVEPLPDTKTLLTTLGQEGSVTVKIEDKGGMNPTRAEEPIIHPEDVERLGVVENAHIKIRYGAKTNWSSVKIARDIMQNFYDGNGHTLEGVDINIVKNDDGTYNVRISGDGHYDYSHLESLGNSSKDGDSANAGAFGEGTRIVAVNLLSHLDTPYVEYACGDWSMKFGRSSDDIQTADMTQTLSKNETTLAGNYIEFKTSSTELVSAILDSKDYFYHPQNKDFQNLDFENEYFGFKLLPEGEKGNLYIVQRYEVNGKATNGLPGFSIVFKKMPNDEQLVKMTGSEYNLGTGRDRIQLYGYQIADLVGRYAQTLSDKELTQVISSMENIWRIQKDKKTDYDKTLILSAFVKEAKRRKLGIDFHSEKYVYLPENSRPEDSQMAELMGYQLALPVMRDAGMEAFYNVSEGTKKPLTPSPEYAAKIHLLDEGVRVLQENADLSTLSYITENDTQMPTLIFDEGGASTEAAEAIIDGNEYLGHWVKTNTLERSRYVDNLATWLHEISHKIGGDTSSSFSYRLIDVQKFIMNVLTHNPAALEKMKVLADLYAEQSMPRPDVQSRPQVEFDEASYISTVQSELELPYKYEEYVESDVNSGAGNKNTDTNNTAEKKILINSNLDKFNGTYRPTTLKSKLEQLFYKLRSRFRKSPAETKSQAETEPTNKSKVYEYEKFTPKSATDENLSLPSTEDYMKQLLEENRPVKFVIPNTGGMNPTRAEVPEIHADDMDKLGKTQNARIKIRYGAKTNWSNTKIARDIMQNFYDGNGHTMEGVGIEVTPQPNGSYKIRITGDGHYDYSHLESLGDSTKDGDSANAGAFGEGTRIVAVNLLAHLDTPYVEYACGDWAMRFGRSSDDIQTADMTQTLAQNEVPVKGNYIEFSTTDESLVATIIDARDYFKHPFNKDFQNPTFENDYFAFKVDENQNTAGNLYYVQRYETSDGKIDGGLNNLTVTFKRTIDDPALKEAADLRLYSIDTGRDRMALNPTQIRTLGAYYARTMSDEELIKSIASLEPVLCAQTTADPKLLADTQDSSIQFARGLIEEAHRRRLKIDFSDAKIVYVSSYKYGDRILPDEVETYLRDKGYKFAYSDCRNIGMKSAQEVYDNEHKPHSVRPTETEVQKLRLIRQAIEIFAQNDDAYGTIPPITGKNEYVFNARESHSEPFHAVIKDKNYDGLFIDRQALAKEDFMTVVSLSIAEMLQVHGNITSAKYSYELTDLIRSELNTFITNPETAQKLKILENMYNKIGK